MTDQHKTGVALVVISAIVFSSAGIFTKGIAAAAWDIVFWRGVAASAFTVGYLLVRGELASEVRCFNRPALAVSVIFAAGSAAFIPAFKLSTVGNVALIYGAVSFIAAALGWIFLGERPTARIAIASMTAFGGVGIIVSGGIAGGHLAGDLLALFMTLMLASGMVVYRAFPKTTAALPAAVSSLLLLPIAFHFGEPLAVPLSQLPLLAFFGLVFAVASVTLSEGARRLAPPETALLSTLELPLAPLLAFAILGERLLPATLIGGTIIVVAVIGAQRIGSKTTKLPHLRQSTD